MKFLDKQPSPRIVYHNDYAGKFKIADGLVDITDPGYDESTWCAIFGKKVLSGEYFSYIDVVNFPDKFEIETEQEAILYHSEIGKVCVCNDRRIMKLQIVHCDYIDTHLIYEPICQIGVDAGLAGFYNHKPNFESEDTWMSFVEGLKHYKKSNNICDMKPYGITVSSGFGDGYYPVFGAHNDEGILVALEIKFYDA